MRYLGGDSQGSHGAGEADLASELKALIKAAEKGTIDMSGFTMDKLRAKQIHLHEDMVHEFHLVRVELNIILYLSLIVFAMPVSIFCKFAYSKLTNSNFIITVSNYMDMAIVLLTSWMWVMVFKFDTDIKREMFNPTEDKGYEVRFIGNIVYDIIDDEFHFDYLMASITAVLWLRCIMILRLTQGFGPTVVMIFRMTSIILQFFVIYVIGLITFASIGTMTLSEADEFHELFDALRIYLMASLGNFDLY